MSLLIVLLIIFLSENFSKQISLYFLVLLLVLLLIAEFWRLEIRGKIPFVCHLFRDREKDRLGGQIFFLIGGIIAYAAFDYRIALAAVLMTSFGDLASSLVGSSLGRIFIMKNRTLEGILAEFTVDLGIAYLLIGDWAIMLVMALIATLVETLVNELDDNLMIPVFSGFVAQAVSDVLR